MKVVLSGGMKTMVTSGRGGTEPVNQGRTTRLELMTEEEDIEVSSEDDNSGTERDGKSLERTTKRG